MDKNTKSITLRGMFQDDVMNTSPEHAHLVEQMEHDPAGYWRTMPGAIQVGDQWSASNGSIIGIIWFQPRPNQRFLVFEEVTGEHTSRLAWLRWPDGVITTICTRARVPGRPASSQFLQSGAWLYHINGIERPIRWDGDRVVPVGFAGAIAAPLVAGGSQGATAYDVAGADLDSSPDLAKSWQRGLGELPASGTARWVVAYGVTEVNDLGQESYMSAISYASGDNDSANGRQAVRIAMPARDAHIHGVNLWRSINIEGGTPDLPVMYLVGRFPFGGSFDFVDMTPDAELGPDVYVPEAAGPVPMGVRCAAFHHDSMWVAVGQQLYRSASLQPEVFPAGNRYDVGSAGSGHIVALFSVPRGLVVACTKGVFMAKGNPVDGYRVESVSEQAECAGPRAFAYIDGLGLVLLTVNGPAVLQGTLDDDTTTKLVPLRGIRKTWRWLVSPIALHNSIVIHRPDVEEVWFHVPRLGETRPSLGFVYHYGGGGLGWSLRPNWRFTSATVYQQRVWLGSWDSDDDDTAGIHLLGRGSVAFASVTGPNEPPDPTEPISPTYTTEPWAIAATGSRWFQRDITGDPVVATYETGVLVSERRIAPEAVEFVGVATGISPGADIQVRFDRRVQFESTNDQEWVDDIHSEQPDLDTDGQKRPKWGISTWDDTGMWVEYEPATIRRPVPGQAHTEFQFRIRGADLRIAGLRVPLIEGNKRTREVT